MCINALFYYLDSNANVMAKLYNLEYLKEISGGDKDFIADMLKDFIENTPSTLLEVKALTNEENWDGLYEVIHRFIPTFDFVGASQINVVLREIECYAKSHTNTSSISQLVEKIEPMIEQLLEEIKNDLKV